MSSFIGRLLSSPFYFVTIKWNIHPQKKKKETTPILEPGARRLRLELAWWANKNKNNGDKGGRVTRRGKRAQRRKDVCLEKIQEGAGDLQWRRGGRETCNEQIKKAGADAMPWPRARDEKRPRTWKSPASAFLFEPRLTHTLMRLEAHPRLYLRPFSVTRQRWRRYHQRAAKTQRRFPARKLLIN